MQYPEMRIGCERSAWNGRLEMIREIYPLGMLPEAPCMF